MEPEPIAENGSVCARVKIEIQQELTLERQAFDAHMRIENGLLDKPITDVKIEVLFTDADGKTRKATSEARASADEYDFFIDLDKERTTIDDVTGKGKVGSQEVADIHWLIIPTVGTGGEDPRGTLYFVGARLTYKIGEQEQVTEVKPDHILVKPCPYYNWTIFSQRTSSLMTRIRMKKSSQSPLP